VILLLPLALAAEPPTFEVERGLYDAPFELALTAADSDDTLFYIIGTGTPDQLYTEPLTIDTTTIVQAFAVDWEGAISAVDTHTYLFLDQVMGSSVLDANVVNDAVYGPALARSLAELPSISVVSEVGIDLTERPVSFEWLDPDGDSMGVSCGAKKVGNASVNYAKYNIRLYFRSAYGPGRLSLDLYQDHATGVPPVDSHDALNLRSGSHDSVFYLANQAQYLRNRWMDESQLEMGHMAPHGRYGHLYLNGVYHGVFHVRERFNAAFLAEYMGGSEDDFEAVNGGSTVDGSGAAWAQVKALAGDYEAVQSWLDVENLLDYMILNYYAANAWDWLYYHNWMAAGPSAPDQGGYVFHSSDSDICLVYDHTTNILHLGGPDNIFASLLSQAHPDFMVLLADRLQAHLGDQGVLSPQAAADRYDALAQEIEEAMAAETARWGAGWWERDVAWANERTRLMSEFFPRRTDALLDQVRAVGWLALPAPELALPEGLAEPGDLGIVQVPEGIDAELWVRLDGGDPREPGGAVAAESLGPDAIQELAFPHSAQLQARLLQGDQWGPVIEAWVEVDESPVIVLNEWNAVAEDEILDDGDTALGRVIGNGGDWLEFVVLESGLDLRGWQLTLTDRLGEVGQLHFLDHDLLADLPAGTLFTVAEDLPEDLDFDPASGDWRFHLQAGEQGPNRVVSATAFDVTHREWQLVLQDADGWVRFGPVGEGISPESGIANHEVGQLAATPSATSRRDSLDYQDSDESSFGSPNVWGDHVQNLSGLRDLGSLPVRLDTADSGQNQDTGVATQAGCGCATAPGSGSAAGFWVGVVLWWRRRSSLLLMAAVGCNGTGTLGDSSGDVDLSCHPDADGDGFGEAGTEAQVCDADNVRNDKDCDDSDPWVNPQGQEVCGGEDEDCDGLVDDDDPDVADPLPFFVDSDGDGYGAEQTTACRFADGLAADGGDCDDTDSSIHPGAAELCDDIDQDCDGSADDALGLSEECPVGSCLEALDVAGVGADGSYWLELASGEVASIWCDLTTDGGGWTLGFLRSSAGHGDQATFGLGEVDVTALEVSPGMASGDNLARMGWLDLNETDWSELQLSAALSGGESYRSQVIPREHLRIQFGEPGYFLYGSESPYYWCGGPASYTDAGEDAVNNPSGAYLDCKGHGSLGSGWDFSESPYANAGLTLCGSDGSSFLAAQWAGSWTYYGTPGGAQGIWVR
jgi:hypothetical protein